jgi:hypothetical protein
LSLWLCIYSNAKCILFAVMVNIMVPELVGHISFRECVSSINSFTIHILYLPFDTEVLNDTKACKYPGTMDCSLFYGLCFVISNALASSICVIRRVILPVNRSADLVEALNVQ